MSGIKEILLIIFDNNPATKIEVLKNAINAVDEPERLQILIDTFKELDNHNKFKLLFDSLTREQLAYFGYHALGVAEGEAVCKSKLLHGGEGMPLGECASCNVRLCGYCFDTILCMMCKPYVYKPNSYYWMIKGRDVIDRSVTCGDEEWREFVRLIEK